MQQPQAPKASPGTVGVPHSRSEALSTSAPGVWPDMNGSPARRPEAACLPTDGHPHRARGTAQPRSAQSAEAPPALAPLGEGGFCVLCVGRKPCEIRVWLLENKKKSRGMQRDRVLLQAETRESELESRRDEACDLDGRADPGVQGAQDSKLDCDTCASPRVVTGSVSAFSSPSRDPASLRCRRDR